MKVSKDLTDKELVTKCESGKINLAKVLKIALKSPHIPDSTKNIKEK